MAFYDRPGAQADLLRLQDVHGGDVMAALWALAAAASGRRLADADLSAFETSTAAARAEAVRRRAVRRAAKGGDPAAYEAAKAAELAAERAVAAAAPPPDRAGDAGEPAAAAAANLERLAERLDPPPPADLLDRLAALAVPAD